MRIFLVLLLAGATSSLGSPAIAQTVPVAGPAIDADSVAAAHTLVDTLLPLASREAMMTSMADALFSRIIESISEKAERDGMFARDARVKPAFERFTERVRARSLSSMRENLPAMIAVMERAYARRFTISEMGEMNTFFSSPAGQAYIRGSATIMADPDVMEWQRQSMAASLSAVKPEQDKFMKDIAEIMKSK